MGAYICASCECLFCSHDVTCYEYDPCDDKNFDLICEGCLHNRNEKEGEE